MPIFKLDEFLLNILPKKRLIGIDPGTKTLGFVGPDYDNKIDKLVGQLKLY